jgi:hypothetical protein
MGFLATKGARKGKWVELGGRRADPTRGRCGGHSQTVLFARKQHIHELPGRNQAQELDPSHSSEYAMSGARRSAGKAQYNHGPAYELHPDSHPGELPSRVDEQTSKAHHQDLGPAATTTDATEMTGTLSNTASLHVEAQRRREIEWLEVEEERICKRLETLASQGSAKT